jgi:hypothetical protein
MEGEMMSEKKKEQYRYKRLQAACGRIALAKSIILFLMNSIKAYRLKAVNFNGF